MHLKEFFRSSLSSARDSDGRKMVLGLDAKI